MSIPNSIPTQIVIDGVVKNILNTYSISRKDIEIVVGVGPAEDNRHIVPIAWLSGRDTDALISDHWYCHVRR